MLATGNMMRAFWPFILGHWVILSCNHKESVHRKQASGGFALLTSDCQAAASVRQWHEHLANTFTGHIVVQASPSGKHTRSPAQLSSWLRTRGASCQTWQHKTSRASTSCLKTTSKKSGISTGTCCLVTVSCYACNANTCRQSLMTLWT